jgi:hypothetical protein
MYTQRERAEEEEEEEHVKTESQVLTSGGVSSCLHIHIYI